MLFTFCLHAASTYIVDLALLRQFIPSNKHLSSRSISIVVVAVVRSSHNLTLDCPRASTPPSATYRATTPLSREMFGRSKTPAVAPSDSVDSQNNDPLADIPKTRWERLWPAMACGSGLFSDGYINNVCYAVALASQCPSASENTRNQELIDFAYRL
jgi:hypothetical protein